MSSRSVGRMAAILSDAVALVNVTHLTLRTPPVVWYRGTPCRESPPYLPDTVSSFPKPLPTSIPRRLAPGPSPSSSKDFPIGNSIRRPEQIIHFAGLCY